MMNKSIPVLFLFSVIVSASVFASGEQEDPEAAVIEVKVYSEDEKAALWNSASEKFAALTEKQPDLLLVDCELTNSKYQSLLNQTAEVRQEIVDGELSRTISEVEPESEDSPPEGPPEGGTESRGGMGRGGSGGTSGGGRPQNGEAEGDGPEIRQPDDKADFNSAIVEDAVEFWDIAFNLFEACGNNAVPCGCDGETAGVFSFICLKYDFSDEENGIKGNVWIDTESGVPVKTAVEKNSDGNLKLEIFILPGGGSDLRISKLFYTADVVSEDDQLLLLQGGVSPYLLTDNS